MSGKTQVLFYFYFYIIFCIFILKNFLFCSFAFVKRLEHIWIGAIEISIIISSSII